MGASYAVWLARDDGTRIASLDQFISLDYVRTIGEAGRFVIKLPGDFDRLLLAKDRKVTIWRKAESGAQRMEFAGVITWLQIADDTKGNPIVSIAGPSLNGLLARRIVAYAAASTQASKTNQADDLMKTIVRENLGADATDSDRKLDASYFTVQPDLTLGPSLTKDFAWRKVSEVLRDLSDAAREAGTEVYYEIAPIDESDFEFRTSVNQPGQDRRASSPAPTILRRGTHLKSCVLTQDYDNEVNVAYAGGQGTEAARVVWSSKDTARTGASLFARTEAFVNASQNSSEAGVQDVADAALIAGRPALKFEAQILEVPGARYGIDWSFGDRVTAEAFGGQYECLIRSVHVTVAGGKETIAARLEFSGN